MKALSLPVEVRQSLSQNGEFVYMNYIVIMNAAVIR